MATYCFKCPICDVEKIVVRPMKDYDLPETCECSEQMRRDFVAEQHAVRGDYNEPIIMDSMAFDAADLDEHRKRFPDVEVVVDHARSARPVIRSLGQKRRYMKRRGWIDRNSFV